MTVRGKRSDQATAGLGALCRIVVVGTSGSGKTTLAGALAKRLVAPHVEFDAYRHGPNWIPTPDDLFRRNIAEALSDGKWVADGNYGVIRDLAWTRATTIVWLDYPFHVVFWRLFRRTKARAITGAELWNGNREILWRHFLTKDSLFLWALQTHWSLRKTFSEALAAPEHSHLAILRFRAPTATDAWVKSIPPAGAPGNGQGLSF